MTRLETEPVGSLKGQQMKFEDLFAPVLSSLVTVSLLVFVYGVPQRGASDTEIAASVSKSVLEFQEQVKEKRRADLKVRIAESRKQRSESLQMKAKGAFRRMTPEQKQEALSKMSPKQKELILGKKEGK